MILHTNFTKFKAETTRLNDTISALRNEVESFRSQSERQAVELAAEKSDHAETLATKFEQTAGSSRS